MRPDGGRIEDVQYNAVMPPLVSSTAINTLVDDSAKPECGEDDPGRQSRRLALTAPRDANYAVFPGPHGQSHDWLCFLYVHTLKGSSHVSRHLHYVVAQRYPSKDRFFVFLAPLEVGCIHLLRELGARPAMLPTPRGPSRGWIRHGC
jgi:hypothetical protein